MIHGHRPLRFTVTIIGVRLIVRSYADTFNIVLKSIRTFASLTVFTVGIYSRETLGILKCEPEIARSTSNWRTPHRLGFKATNFTSSMSPFSWVDA